LTQFHQGSWIAEQIVGSDAQCPTGGGKTSADDELRFILKTLVGFLLGWKITVEELGEDGWMACFGC